jgi:hypothetical protein
MNARTDRTHSRVPRPIAAIIGLCALCASPHGWPEEQDPHAKVFAEEAYPSAKVCSNCHQQIFWEWAASNHAYSSISPMFHKFEQTINVLSSGTVGSFCVRCHQQIGTQRNEPREQPLWERSEISREGVTCITCHRVNAEFGKVNGERHVQPATIFEPVYGAGLEENLDEVIQDPEYYNLSTRPDAGDDKGTPIHLSTVPFDQISKSEFCVSCHQVAVHPGIKLEVVWDQYRDSPGAKHGITCQECHMGKVPGKPEGYDTSPIAIVNGRVIGEDKKHSNHSFYGPGYPIAHPGLFPYNPRALRWEIEAWLKFNYRAPWGEREWEEKLARGEVGPVDFPSEWSDREDRELARYVVTQNQQLLDQKRELRRQVMENGSRIDGPFFKSPPRVGEDLSFHYRVTNIDEGHNLPSGSLGAQPEIWLNVVLVGPDGNWLWESGHVDSHGDMADLHSLDVAAKKIEHDDQLFNLQTKFLTTNVKGTDREMYLPVNFDIDQLPFIRPPGVPTTVLNHPPFIRMEGRSIPPFGYRDAKYEVDGQLLSEPGKYKLQARLRSRAEPIYFMKFVGATVDMERAMNEWMLDIHPYAVEFEVK